MHEKILFIDEVYLYMYVQVLFIDACRLLLSLNISYIINNNLFLMSTWKSLTEVENQLAIGISSEWLVGGACKWT